MRDLGTLGGKSSSAYDINERGQVVGQITVKFGTYRAFFWENGTMRDLGSPGRRGGASTTAYAINDHGQVAGEWTSGCCSERVFVWQNGKMRDIGTLAGKDTDPGQIVGTELPADSAAKALNNRGWIIGESWTASEHLHGFLWRKGTMRDLGFFFSPVAVNDRGQVLGENELWEGGRTRHLPIGTARDLNERGVVACTRPAPGGQALPCVWRRGIVRNIPLVFGRVAGATMSLNDRDQVIGSTFGAQAFVWQSGKTTALPLLPGGKSSKAQAINNRGWIVGTSQTVSGAWHAVLWTYKP